MEMEGLAQLFNLQSLLLTSSEEVEQYRYVQDIVQPVQGKYQSIYLIHQGGFGAVYRMTHNETGATRACKFFKREKVDAILREANILQDLTDVDVFGYIVPYYGLECEENRHYLVMGYMAGNMDQWLDTIYPGGVTAFVFRRLAKRILMAFDFLDRHNIFHGDVKPNNFLMSMQDPCSLKICDFGMAKRVSSNGLETIIKYSSIYIYRAPEVFLGCPTKNPRSPDIWAVGCVLLKALFNRDYFTLGRDVPKRLRKVTILDSYSEHLGRPDLDILFRCTAYKQTQHMIHNTYRYPEDGDLLLQKLKVIFARKASCRWETAVVFSFLNRMLCWDPDLRATPSQLLKDTVFL